MYCFVTFSYFWLSFNVYKFQSFFVKYNVIITTASPAYYWWNYYIILCDFSVGNKSLLLIMNCSAEDTYTLDKLMGSMIKVECQEMYYHNNYRYYFNNWICMYFNGKLYWTTCKMEFISIFNTSSIKWKLFN